MNTATSDMCRTIVFQPNNRWTSVQCLGLLTSEVKSNLIYRSGVQFSMLFVKVASLYATAKALISKSQSRCQGNSDIVADNSIN